MVRVKGNNPRPQVALLIPSYRCPHPRTTAAVYAMIRASAEVCDVFTAPIVQSSIVHWTRNRELAELIRSQRPFTHVLFMDDDIVPPTDALMKLLGHKKDVVAGLCTVRQDPPLPNARMFDEAQQRYNELWYWPEGVLLEVGAVGTGLMLISREALQKVAEAYFDCRFERDVFGMSAETAERWSKARLTDFDETANAWWFRFLPTLAGAGEYGEDISFCHVARKYCGLKVYVDTSVQPEHIGDYGFSISDFLPYREAVLAKAQAEGRVKRAEPKIEVVD